jgi:hypothetical protein
MKTDVSGRKEPGETCFYKYSTLHPLSLLTETISPAENNNGNCPVVYCSTMNTVSNHPFASGNIAMPRRSRDLVNN